ncbi:glutamate 5-kinase [Athelia psychrophila]|uniref:Glutamate 5-kinase n=1 Tax=Athelia psychrophila TaxID=1759441 RepID=A0A166CMG5_9AGAM|nr:glutamate 5-kinase [Fibularhizoctonia sp. CBS 109695]
MINDNDYAGLLPVDRDIGRPRPGIANCVIVIKLGTSSIVSEKTHQPLLSTLAAVVETVIHLRSQGHKVILVSSGAIGVGLKRMNLESKPKSLSGKQALAAIGQGRLIALWDNLFGQFEQPIAQVLLTRGDISDRTRYLNAVNTFRELLNMGVVPIVNENDTISVSEIKFGDNDTLSAITSSMVQADYLFLLTDVDGLYTTNPRKDPAAKAIQTVTSIADIRTKVSTSTLGSSLGTGGMETKLIAAEIATETGVTTVITSSKKPENILGIIDYHSSLTIAASSAPTSPTSKLAAPSTIERPPHTVFEPSPSPLRDIKSWTSHTLFPSGTVVIDAGAHHVLSRRESGGRLLPAGVVDVIGAFASGQAVRIVIRRPVNGSHQEDPELARAVYLSGMAMTRAGTPTLLPTSMTSSITSLDSLSMSTPLVSNSVLPDDDQVLVDRVKDGNEAWEELEVGRGLANYNSAQIEKLKGLNSSYIAQTIGYSDSDYVVENCVLRIKAIEH